MRKIFAYLRVSGTNQLDGYGFERQLDAVEKYCKRAKYKIEKVFQEQVSGTKSESERPVFANMVKEILSDSVRIVVIESLDRFAREQRVSETLLIYLVSKGITLINASTGENVTEAISDNPMKKALIQIQGIFHELDKSQIIKRVQDGRKRSNKRQGRKPYGQHPLYPEEEGTLKLIRSLHKATKTRKALGYSRIAEELNERGIRTRPRTKGKKKYPDGNTWSPALVFHTLKQ